ncbi:Uncharacterised protein [Mycobacteroides abscessus]|nr:Uncharacterised protein [Mycobacteroides abscessus]
MLGHLHCAGRVHHGAFGHHPVGRERAGVHPLAIGQPGDAVHAGDGREGYFLAAVVFSGDDGSGEIGQRGRLDGGDLGAAGGLWVREVGVGGLLPPLMNDCCLHGVLLKVSIEMVSNETMSTLYGAGWRMAIWFP